jgi:predicted transcriptional regulator
MTKSRVQITTYVSSDVAAQLEALAEEQDRSLASLLRLALQELLERNQYAKEAVKS